MKTIITTLLTIALFIGNSTKPCLAQQTTSTTSATATTYKLTAVISGIEKRAGKLYVGLANNAETFNGESAATATVDVSASGDVTVNFDGLKPGRYAVRVYQDLNDNKKMDFSGQMPAEPFGFSNVTMLMGPPTFDQCAFTLGENKTIQVGMMSL
ncbi:DUF2141 domain-containing protein [Spirosoma fluviale]|uniref:Uncharacterized conserved protein, DUF2141 family n=1 Tax=Spirosoma fluviale TaxID=1597977 RepID=A0A286GM49_9BACT|nr:DUF2141 domain-containing protein [Spirosoma fluviale]SOD96607.1 Uncharacterized conserved protein, DUF2141 family [Spirosoma fluviale]